jgi:signal transduction histidine kinase
MVEGEGTAGSEAGQPALWAAAARFFILAVDKGGRVVFAGGSAIELLPSPRRLKGRPLREFLGGGSPLSLGVARALSGSHDQLTTRLGHHRVELSFDPCWADDQVVGCTVTGLDATRHEQSADALQRRDVWLRLLLRQIPAGFWATDRDLRFTFGAGRLRQSLDRLRRPPMLGQRLGDYLGARGEDDPVIAGHLKALSGRESSFRYEYRGRTYDVHLEPLYGDGGRSIEGTVGVAVDATTHFVTLAELRASVSLLRATLDSTADGLLVVDRQGHVVAFNQRFVGMWHIPEELIDSRDDERLLEWASRQVEDPPGFLAAVRALYSQSDAASFDVLHFKDGRIFERYSQPQRICEEIVGRVWSFRDVTERDQLLRRVVFLAHASRLLGSLDAEHGLEGVARLTVPFLADGCVVDLLTDESKARRLVSISRRPDFEMIDEPPEAVYLGRSLIFAANGRSHIAVPLTVRGRVLGAMTLAANQGHTYGPAELALAEELADRGALALENAHLYEQAEAALSARDEFLSIAAHELRSPLTALGMAMYCLKRETGGTSANPRMLDIIDRETRRISRFVDELLEVARINAGRMHFELEIVDLAEVIREVATRLEPELRRSGSTVSIDAEPRVEGCWDRSRLDQIVTNLLANAIKFGMGRPITLALSATPDQVRLLVRDQGVGIESDAQELIFQPFKRAATADHHAGLGLGLYIVRTIAAGLGGTVRVDSAPGRGAAFEVMLPRRPV